MKRINPLVLAFALAGAAFAAATFASGDAAFDSVCSVLSPEFTASLNKLEQAANDGAATPTYEDAMTLSLAFAQSDEFKNASRLEQAAYYRNLSWLQLKLKQYTAALDSSKQAILLYPPTVAKTLESEINRLIVLSIAIRVPEEIHAWLQDNKFRHYRSPEKLLASSTTYLERGRSDLAVKTLFDGMQLLVGKSIYDRDVYFAHVYNFLSAAQIEESVSKKYFDELRTRYTSLGGTHDFSKLSAWNATQHNHVRAVPPAYPGKAARAGISGCVYVEYDVLTTGKVRVVKATEMPEGHGFLAPAVTSVKKTRWDKLTDIDGNPAESHVQFRNVTFLMQR